MEQDHSHKPSLSVTLSTSSASSACNLPALKIVVVGDCLVGEQAILSGLFSLSSALPAVRPHASWACLILGPFISPVAFTDPSTVERFSLDRQIDRYIDA